MSFGLSPRFSTKKDITPGPGAYSPQDIKNKTGHTFSKAARFPPPAHSDTPGPGAIPVLQDAGVSTVYVEHLYEAHLESIRAGDLDVAEEHLNRHTYLRVDGTPSPAADFCRFVQACEESGIHVVSIEDPAIYRHYPDLRIPNLNNRAVDIITTLAPPEGKALVYIGAAHTNSHNDLGRTPGLAEVLEGAVEMVVVGDDFELPIHSVGEGCVFRIG